VGSLIQELQVRPWLEYRNLPLALISSSAKTGHVHVFPLAHILQPGFFSPYIGAIRSRIPRGSSCYSPRLMSAVHGKKPKSMLWQILSLLQRPMLHSMKRRMADRASISLTYIATKSGFQSRSWNQEARAQRRSAGRLKISASTYTPRSVLGFASWLKEI